MQTGQLDGDRREPPPGGSDLDGERAKVPGERHAPFKRATDSGADVVAGEDG